jgi:hypothetical protein
MTKLAQLVAKQEGFGIAGAIPTVRHNPGDLRHSPHSQHPGGPAHKDDVGTIDTDEHGWSDLERQLQIYAEEGLTLRQMVNLYCGLPKDPPIGAIAPDGNNVATYLHTIASGLNLPPATPVREALKIAA